MKAQKVILFVFICFLGLPFSGLAQFSDSGPLELGLFGGVSTYNGDLQQYDYTFRQSHPAFGLFLSKEIHKGFGVELGINFGKLSGADSLATDSFRTMRNLDFQTNILDVHLLVTYRFLRNMNIPVHPYVFAGISVYHFDPYTYYTDPGDSISKKYYLQPLHTEGQGLAAYPERKPYNLTQVAIPFGVGVKYALSPTVNIGAVVSMRKVFTDYIDDLSRSYADFSDLHGMQPFSPKLAFRTDELPGHENDKYPAAGATRGNPDKNDFYFFTGLKLSINLKGLSLDRQKALKHISCPPAY